MTLNGFNFYRHFAPLSIWAGKTICPVLATSHYVWGQECHVYATLRCIAHIASITGTHLANYYILVVELLNFCES